MTRYFHFLSNQKNIKETSFEQFQQIIKSNQTSSRRKLVVAVGKHWINFHNGSHFVFADTRQIAAALEATNQ